jgi:predicted metalloprotease with PDZ domain
MAAGPSGSSGRSFWPLLIALLALPLLGATRPGLAPVAYQLSPVFIGGYLIGLQVEVRFKGDASGVTEFGWASHFAGDRRLSRWAQDVTIRGAESVVDEGGGQHRIRAVAGAPLLVRYRIVSAYDHDPTADDAQQALPVIRPTWFFAVGRALFAEPHGRDGAPATFAWTGAPEGFGFASDLEHLAGPDHPGLRPGTVADVLDSVVVGGSDLHLYGALDGAPRVRVATVGRFAFAPEALDALARRVISVERRFWGADESAPFLVAAMSLQRSPDRQSLSGTGLTDAFALWIDESLPLSDVTWLLGHEYFHTWNPTALGGFPDTPRLEPSSLYWFSEGVTDYYARALMVRAGLITPRQFAAQWNDTLRAYATSPFERSPNAVASKQFWTSDAGNKIPYQRGALLAAIWNARLRGLSGEERGLDDVLRAQAAQVRASPDGRDMVDRFIAVAGAFGLNVRPDVDRFVERGEAISLPPDVFGRCARVVTREQPMFAYGFDVPATLARGMMVTGVEPDSRAYAAGLRNGMRILRKEAGVAGEPMAPYAFLVAAGPTRRVISYLPQKSAEVSTQSVELASNLTSDCRRTLSGL